MYRGNTTIPSKTAGGPYTVYWYAISDNNYESASGNVSVVIARKTGNITLSKTSESITAGSKSSVTFTVTGHHGGTLTVIDDNGTATSSVSGNTVTLSNLSSISSGTIKVTVTSSATGEYNAASASYTLTILEKYRLLGNWKWNDSISYSFWPASGRSSAEKEVKVNFASNNTNFEMIRLVSLASTSNSLQYFNDGESPQQAFYKTSGKTVYNDTYRIMDFGPSGSIPKIEKCSGILWWKECSDVTYTEFYDWFIENATQIN